MSYLGINRDAARPLKGVKDGNIFFCEWAHEALNVLLSLALTALGAGGLSLWWLRRRRLFASK
jgi:hypothetical protein